MTSDKFCWKKWRLGNDRGVTASLNPMSADCMDGWKYERSTRGEREREFENV